MALLVALCGVACSRAAAPAAPALASTAEAAPVGACEALRARCLADCDDLRRAAPDDPGELRVSCRRDCQRAHATRDGGCEAR